MQAAPATVASPVAALDRQVSQEVRSESLASELGPAIARSQRARRSSQHSAIVPAALRRTVPPMLAPPQYAFYPLPPVPLPPTVTVLPSSHQIEFPTRPKPTYCAPPLAVAYHPDRTRVTEVNGTQPPSLPLLPVNGLYGKSISPLTSQAARCRDERPPEIFSNALYGRMKP